MRTSAGSISKKNLNRIIPHIPSDSDVTTCHRIQTTHENCESPSRLFREGSKDVKKE
jgi:hypothetical protein